MKQVIIIIAIGSITTGLFAQSKRASRVSPWDSLYFKNEISLDVSPVMVALLGDVKDLESVGLTYRRFLSKRNALRFGFRTAFEEDFYEGDEDVVGYIKQGTPDSIKMVYSGSSFTAKSRWYTLRPGYEHRFGKRRVKLILGIDVIVGIEKFERYESFGTRESALVPYDSSISSFSTTLTYSDLVLFSGKEPDYNSTTSFMLGFAPVFGLNIHLAKRWSLNGTVFYDFYGRFPFKYTGQLARDLYQKEFYATGEPVFADVSLTFNF